MEERKGTDKKPEIPEEEYSFLQEVIKDEAGSGKKLKRDILRMAGFGVIVGIAACISFCVFRPWMETKLGGDPEEITIPQDDEKTETEENSEKENGDEAKQEDKEEQVPSAASYKQMLQSLKNTAKETANSIVSVLGVTDGQEWSEELNAGRQSTAGVVVADNGQEFLILGKVCTLKNTERFFVTFADGSSCEAVEKARDANLGLSVYGVLHSDIDESTRSKIDTAVLGNSKLVNEGDTVIVAGKPFGYASAFTYGVVSDSKTKKNLADGQYSVLYTDVAGNAGASGVMVNIRGEVIGMIDQDCQEEEGRNLIAGYGISDIKDVIEQLSNGQSVPYIGIYGVDVTEDMEDQGLPQGVYVKDVEEDSPAMSAGIQNGDVIIAVNNKEVTGVDEYHQILMKKKKGSEVVLKGRRQGTGGEYVDVDFSVTIGAKK